MHNEAKKDDDRRLVLILSKSGFSGRKIAISLKRSLKFVQGVPGCFVHCTLNIFHHKILFFLGILKKRDAGVDPLVRKGGSGRRRKTTKLEDRTMVYFMRKYPKENIPALIKDSAKIKVSRWTISRRLKEV